MAFGVFSKFKKEAILTNVCFSTAPMDFFAFSHGFQHKNFSFTARPLAHRSTSQSATYKNAEPISQKFVF
jgi:hypothetical protein